VLEKTADACPRFGVLAGGNGKKPLRGALRKPFALKVTSPAGT
jgi:hypothetical protein